MEKEKLEELLRNKLLEFDYELVSLTISYSKDDMLVSLVIDRVAPIDMESISEVSMKVSEYFDEIDPFDRAYTLDISSLGAEKPLKIQDLSKYLSSYIHVHLINPIAGENIYEGDLVDVKEDTITLSYRIKTRTKLVDIAKANISKIRLAIKF